MFNHLKTLPLTILLTILIWMYAEAQFAKHQTASETISNLPVWVSGPRDIVSRYDVELHPSIVPKITVTGSPDAIQQLRLRLAAADPSIHAYFDLRPDDLPSPNFSTRRLRYSLPEDITLQAAPADLDFRLLERAATTHATTR